MLIKVVASGERDCGHLPSFCMVLCFLLLYVLFMIRKIIFKKDVSSQGLGDKNNMSLCSL